MEDGMSPQEIKEALNRPPVFGDVRQIAALKALRIEEEEREGQTEFRVTVTWGGEETVTVWAADEDDARSKARDAVDMFDSEIEYHVRKV